MSDEVKKSRGRRNAKYAALSGYRRPKCKWVGLYAEAEAGWKYFWSNRPNVPVPEVAAHRAPRHGNY